MHHDQRGRREGASELEQWAPRGPSVAHTRRLHCPTRTAKSGSRSSAVTRLVVANAELRLCWKDSQRAFTVRRRRRRQRHRREEDQHVRAAPFVVPSGPAVAAVASVSMPDPLHTTDLPKRVPAALDQLVTNVRRRRPCGPKVDDTGHEAAGGDRPRAIKMDPKFFLRRKSITRRVPNNRGA